MFARALLLTSLAATLVAQPDPNSVLVLVREKVLQTVDRLPKYLCTETIDRSEYEPDHSQDVPSCDQLVDRKQASRANLHLAYSDRLRLDVAVSASAEIYSWVGESRFGNRSLFDLVGNGSLSTGTFANFLKMIFASEAADFYYAGETLVEGRTLMEFEFHVPVEKSHYDFSDRRRHWRTAYEGSILIDPQTSDLINLRVRTSNLPVETSACEAATTLRYRRFRLNNADFLLPAEARLTILDANGMETENRTVYSGCREFLGESKLRAEPSEPAVTSSGPEPKTRALDLPRGLAFAIALTRDIDVGTAAAGDSFAARLTAPIRDSSSRVLVPKGAAVNGRIVRIQRYYKPVSSLTVALRLESVEVGGAPVPLAASAATEPNRSPGNLRSRRLTFQLVDAPEPGGVAVLHFGPVKQIKRGVECKWTTAR